MNSNNPFQDSAFDLMTCHLADVTVEMYADHEIAMALSESATSAMCDLGSHSMGIAVIGYVGECVRGALTLIALESTIDQWLCKMGMEGGDPSDALGEFSNMLLGRLKTRLLSEGIVIQLATPTIAVGSGLRLSPAQAHSTSAGFDGPTGYVCLRLDANFDAEFTFTKPMEAAPAAEAGDAFLF